MRLELRPRCESGRLKRGRGHGEACQDGAKARRCQGMTPTPLAVRRCRGSSIMGMTEFLPLRLNKSGALRGIQKSSLGPEAA